MAMTIPEIRKAIDETRADIAHECDIWEHNCQACSYERLCSNELNFFIRQLKEAYCKQANHDCSMCDYLKECDDIKARNEIQRQKYQKHIDTCNANSSDCRKCEYFEAHCNFDKGHHEWLAYVEECCEERYGCRKCPASRFCMEEKNEHIAYLKLLVFERKYCK